MDDRLTRVKADIVPYAPEYSRTVLSWIESEETFFNVCRGIDFPPSEDLITGWQREGVNSYLLFASGKPVAYGELWSRPLELAVEIAHLLVDPLQRFRGYGSKMLHLLYQRAAQRPNVAKVILNFHTGDESILGCYLKAGFELVSVKRADTRLRMERPVK